MKAKRKFSSAIGTDNDAGPNNKSIMEFASTLRTMEHAGSVLIAGISMKPIPVPIKVEDVVLKVKERVEALKEKDAVLLLTRLKLKLSKVLNLNRWMSSMNW